VFLLLSKLCKSKATGLDKISARLLRESADFMLIGSRQRLSTYDKSPSLSIDDKSIKRVSSTNTLGVHIDQNLSSNVHIETIAKKIASGLGALKRCR